MINPCKDCIVLAVCKVKVENLIHVTSITYASTILYMATFCSLLNDYIDLVDHSDDNVCTYDQDAIVEAAESLGLKQTEPNAETSLMSLNQIQFIRGMK